MATPAEGGGGHAPPGIRLLKWLRGNRELSFRTHRALVLVLTFIAYALYHASRKPPSIVKSVLESSSSSPDSSLGISRVFGGGGGRLDQIYIPFKVQKGVEVGDVSSLAISGVVSKGGGVLDPIYAPFEGGEGVEANIASSFSTSKVVGKGGSSVLDRIYIRREIGSVLRGWAPFEGEEGVARLGEVDVAFLAAYAFGMYFAGHLGDRLSLRLFLAVGMVGSGACVCLFGMASWWGIHRLFYFIVVQMAAGLLQATGWPSVVSVVGNWFGKRKRGLIMGIWNAHTSVGNIVGSLVAAAMLKYGWGWSFLVPGAAIVAGGLLLFLFLVASPSYVGLPSPYQQIMPNNNDEENNSDRAKTPLLTKDEGVSEAVSFLQAWAIPGVAPFAFCLFFAKLVAYTFLYWLPFYIHNTAIQGQYFSDATAGNLSTVFDIGGVFGGIVAGHVSDKLKARATVAASFMFAAVPTLFLYRTIGNSTLWANITLLVLSGVFVNGPYALITTAVSADLGTHSSLKGNARALATVTAIIDGTGSIGAALGPLITGFISTRGWNNVFYLLMVSALVAGLMLSRLVFFEMKEKLQRFHSFPSDTQS